MPKVLQTFFPEADTDIEDERCSARESAVSDPEEPNVADARDNVADDDVAPDPRDSPVLAGHGGNLGAPVLGDNAAE